MTKERALAFLDECCEVVERVNQINQKYGEEGARMFLGDIQLYGDGGEKVALAAQKTVRYQQGKYLSECGLVRFEHKGVEFYSGYGY